jgi:hypothetical protein
MKAGTLANREEVRIDPSLIPPAVAEQIAAAACEGVLEFFQQPGVQEKFDAWLQERKRRKETV